MRTRIGVILLVSLLVLVANVGLVSAYTPRPGVLSPEEVDFGGKTVTIFTRDIDWVVFNGGKPEDERIAEAEKLYNVKIELRAADSQQSIEARIMAGDSTYDVIRFNHRSGYFPLAANGMLLPVGQLLPDEYFQTLPTTDRYTIEKLAFRGDYYGFGVVYGKFNGSMMMMVYDREMLEESQVDDPYELWVEGRWDYEEFERLLVELTRDTTGDGEIDQHGFFDITSGTAAYRFLPFNNVEIAKKDEDGKWVYALNEKEAINAVNLINRWRSLGVLGSNAVFNTSHLAGMRNDAAAGKQFGMVPFPQGPDTDRSYSPAFDFSSNFLPINCAYPEGMIALVDFLFREEDGDEYFDFYVNNYMQSRDHMDVYESAADNWMGEGDPFQASGIWEEVNPAIQSALTGEKGVAAAFDEIAQVVQAALDDLFAQ